MTKQQKTHLHKMEEGRKRAEEIIRKAKEKIIQEKENDTQDV